MLIDRSLVWMPCPGMSRDGVVAEIRKDCVSLVDRGDHLWAVIVNNKGPCLFCFGIGEGVDSRRSPPETVVIVKRIPEDVGPDVYDCPIELLEAARPTNETWRERVRQWHEPKPK